MRKSYIIVFVLAVFSLRSITGAESSLPKDLKGFSGQVRGVVMKKGEKNTFTFKVARVLKVWKNNKAENAKSLAGHTVKVGPRWLKNDKGSWHPAELHVAFIKKLKAGQEITLEIVNLEASHFNILELSGDQREIAGNRDKKSPESNKKEKEKEESESAKDAEIRELRKQVEALKEEIRSLRRQLQSKKEK